MSYICQKSSITLLLAFFIATSFSVHVHNGNNDIYEQFINYVDVITLIKLDHMLEKVSVFLQQVMASIPYDDRGDSARVLQQLQDEIEQSIEGGSISNKEKVLQQFQDFIAGIKMETKKNDIEDLIIRRGLSSTFELLARLSIEERKFHENFVRAYRVLRTDVASGASTRYRELLHIVSLIAAEENIVNWKNMLKDYKIIKEHLK